MNEKPELYIEIYICIFIGKHPVSNLIEINCFMFGSKWPSEDGLEEIVFIGNKI